MLMWLFVAFKVIQIAVFVGWHLVSGDGTFWPYSRDPAVVAGGVVFIAAGQALNVSVFRRLGKVGVFYGNSFGYTVSWCQRFPFNWFEHPQYVGTVIAIWGFFLRCAFQRRTGWSFRCSRPSTTRRERAWNRTQSRQRR